MTIFSTTVIFVIQVKTVCESDTIRLNSSKISIFINIKTKLLYFLFWTCMFEIRNAEFYFLYLAQLENARHKNFKTFTVLGGRSPSHAQDPLWGE